MKFLRILFLLCLTGQAFAQDKTVALKINLVKGESTVTTLPNPSAVEKIIADAFSQKGYTVLTRNSALPTDSSTLENLVLADAFVYQYPADYPSITLTIRKNGYIFRLLHDSKKLFADRQSATESIAAELAKQIPASLEETRFLLPQLEHLLPAQRISIYSVATGAITDSYAKKYLIDTGNSQLSPSNFIIEGALEGYLSLCLDFNGYRSAAKSTPIVVDFTVDRLGFTKITNIQASPDLKEEHKAKIKAAIEALPLWNPVSRQPGPRSITLGLKK